VAEADARCCLGLSAADSAAAAAAVQDIFEVQEIDPTGKKFDKGAHLRPRLCAVRSTTPASG
jgi:hypothetical protein